jgi:hypothetical protein
VASWLVLDWDQDQFHVLSAQGSRRGVQVTKAVTWTPPEPLTPGSAERVGKVLRDFLKAAGIPAAPVIVGLGRDRVFLKELRFPPLAAHEEAALVRFQTAKELAEPADNYAVDYVHMSTEGTDRQIMTVAAKREILTSIQTLCAAAGLKLHAVTPRLFGVGHVLPRAVQPEPNPLTAGKLNVVLSISQRWAELCFFRGPRLIQAQALANGALLVNEVKRNLAVFQAQHAVDVNLTGPERLYVFGDDPATLEALQTGQPLPIQSLNPLDEELEVAAKVKHPAYFAGAVGLAALWLQTGIRPVNLAAPKKAQAPVSITRQRGIFYGAAAAALVIFFVGGMYYVLAQKRAELQQLTADKKQIEDDLQRFAQQRAELDAYKEWQQTTIPWLDELYDLSARFPYAVGFRTNKMTASPVLASGSGAKNKGKDGYVASIALNIVKPASTKEDYVRQLQQSMSRDTHLTSKVGHIGSGKGSAPQIIDMKIDVAKQSVLKYDTHLIVPQQPIIAAVAPPVPTAAVPAPDAEGDEP